MKNSYKQKKHKYYRNYGHKKLNHLNTNNADGKRKIYSKYISNESENSGVYLYDDSITFSELNLDPVVLRNVHNRKFNKPTKIQSKVIPQVLSGNDLIGLATTGSGKTAAFLLPLITKIMNNRKNKCLVIAPTRELARQIKFEFEMFSKDTRTFCVLIVGGDGYGPQINLLSRNPQFVIATPGRLIDLQRTNRIDLSSFNIVVLDEVDTMLDMGFIKDINLIISKLASQKQSLFFSATINPHVEKIAKNILINPIMIEETSEKVSINVDQSIRKYKFNGEKLNILHKLIEENNYGKFLVFARTRRGADKLAKELKSRGLRSLALHGNKSQGQRNKAVSQFRSDRVDILVATDVASRGIDIKNITHVINYDEPATYDDYIHRIGRTGRIGKKGTAITFVK